MVETFLLIIAAVIVVSAVIIFKVAKGVLQAILLVSAVASIVLAVSAGLVVKDALDFSGKFQTESSMLLFANSEGTALTSGIIMKDKKPDSLAAADVARLNQFFVKNDYQSMLGDSYRLLVIKEAALTGSLPGENLSKLPESGSSGERAEAVMALYVQKVSADPLFLIAEYKKGNIIIYPATPVFKAVKALPLSLMKKAIGVAFQKAGQAVGKVEGGVVGALK
ncbi:hypothetical protein HYV83_05765 [Candidatus Woesearchaeota archaeon]|nr:hypothetical protein [Candidatus Woesearchaeota archaeon]